MPDQHQPLTDVFFDSFDLHPSLLSSLHAAGFTRCTPIQALTLPVALTGRDVAGQAQTGTGKTGAFLVAVMNRLLTRAAVPERKDGEPRAVILAPTRELAIQIDKDFRNIGRNTGLRSALIYGGVDYDKQRELLKAGCDIVIATPGRLIDYLKQHVVSFRSVEAVVIDEADRMFDLGFIKDIRFLLRRMPPREERQGMLFSATLSYRVLELAYEHMNSPEKLAAETESVTASRVRQVVYFPATEEKMPLLLNLLGKLDEHRSIVFINTKAMAERVTRSLERQGHRVATLSGDVPQAKRERLLARFQKGDIELLVATDVAARGLHIPAVSHVFNYDLPQDAEDYVHRIGRTARLGAEGDAISFACDLYAMGLPDIETYIGQKIPTAAVDPSLLIVPPPKPRSEGMPADSDEDAADDARNTAGAPPKQGDGRHRSGRDGERSRSRPGERRGEARPPRAPRPPREAPAPSAPAPVQPPAAAAAATAGPVTAAPADGAPAKKRRRRGGRGRGRRENGESMTLPAATATAPEPRGENKPRRERPARAAGGDVQPAAVSAPAAQAPKKPGFFRSLARLFGKH
ncbi:ATP-dependent RNA helicase RhlB [Dokdonella koreensis]|uniref:ATP-dependent RNA helicase RhlB n=1 Tax=Dokdonella koreensis DS-123 TaxID=1300342 RepID=A0A167GJH6_9GAMM|nr:ATP-dependent RNA helicase RhlB [Dokdonella koreensis]ANB16629.1 ATP-dependent RNA helicase RhlB [Dokdonella koreensis DS-123]